MQRKLYNDLSQWKNDNKRKPLILRGARQTGKTYLLKYFGEKNFKVVHYFNFEVEQSYHKAFNESLDPKQIIKNLEIISEKKINLEKDFIIFDEVQSCSRALHSLKYFAEMSEEHYLAAAGSLLGIYLDQESFPVGKVVFLDLYPLCFEEFLEWRGKAQLLEFVCHYKLEDKIPEFVHDKLWQLYLEYLFIGGLPEVVASFIADTNELSFESAQRVIKIQDNLINAYSADIAKHSGKVNSLHIDRVWRSIPLQLARSQDESSSKYKLKDAVPGVKGYQRLASAIDWLIASGLVIKLMIANKAEHPLLAYTKENSFKLFCYDTGMLLRLAQTNLTNILEQTKFTYKGYLAENFVIRELMTQNIDSIYCWKEKESEIEFLVNSNSGIIPIEVKSGYSTRARSLAIYKEKYQPKNAIVFSANLPRIGKSTIYLPIYLACRIHKLLA